jgi:acyl-CoA thioester hydrolase, YbgC/YbaW family
MGKMDGEVQIRVRYKDTDKMGVMHHSNYVNCYEVARTELMRERGLSYREMEERGVMLPVREVYMNYISPAYYDNLLTVRIRIAEEPRVKLVFDHEIYNESGELINTGKVVLVFVNAETRRPCRAPQWFLELFGY